MKIEGELYKVYAIKYFGDKFRNQTFSIKHIDKNKKPQFLMFQATNDKIELLEGYSPGDKIIITFKLEGREYKNKNNEDFIFDIKEVLTIDSPPSLTEKIEQDYKNKKLDF